MNEFQQTFVYSIASNATRQLTNWPIDQKSPLKYDQQATNKMQSTLKDELPAILRSMGIESSTPAVWGPAVYIQDKDIKFDYATNTVISATATNTIVVFQTGANSYTVAIAGTKPTSVFDTMKEDSDIASMENWVYGSPSHRPPKISRGTHKGLDILLNRLVDPDQKNTIQAFLSSSGINSAQNTVTITGHSLGGALASALALALYGTAVNTGYKLLQKARVYATAGPDVGNEDYVNYFSQSFKPTGTQGKIWEQYNVKIWNSMDVVPQAWSNLKAVESIYNPQMETPNYIKCVINEIHFLLSLLSNHYAPMDPLKKGQFKGDFKVPKTTAGYDCVPGADLPAGFCDFVAEMLYQHIQAYYSEFNINFDQAHVNIKPCAVSEQLYHSLKKIPIFACCKIYK